MVDVGVALGIAGVGVALPALAEVRPRHSNPVASLSNLYVHLPIDGRHIWKICCQQVQHSQERPT